MGDSTCVDKQSLALDALSNLSGRFSEKPDFGELIDQLLMTLCGQFAVANAFALLLKPSSRGLKRTYFATGDFKDGPGLESLAARPSDWCCLVRDRAAIRAEGLADSPCARSLSRVLRGAGVVLVSPLIHNDEFLGVIGLGARLSGGRFDDEDLELLNTITHTVTPLIANSYLFWDMANLKAWYLEILNNVKQGVFVFDQRCRLRKVNKAGVEILNSVGPRNTDPEALDGAPLNEVFPEPQFEAWAARFCQAIENREALLSDTASAGRDGDHRIFNVSIVAGGKSAQGEPSYILTLDDVTELKRREQKLFDLQIAADRGKMASTIAHELNNFLTLLLGGVELLGIAVEDGNAHKVRETMGKLRDQVTNLERFTRDLSDVTSIGSSRRALDLNALINDVVSFISVQKRFRGLKIVRDLGRIMPSVAMDKDQITQVLLNLLTNAADAIAESKRTDGLITIATTLDRDGMELRVSDNGPGLKPGVEDRLFAENVTTKPSGHGYGLMTCARIVRSHGGTIEANSAPGEGTVFTIRFPSDAAA